MYSLLRIVMLVSAFSIAISATIARAQTNTLQPGWKVLQLPYGWIINVPKDFTTKRYQGIDSHPGVVRSRKRKIELEYDIITDGVRAKRKPDCDTTRAVILWLGIQEHDDWRGREISTQGTECRNDSAILLTGKNLAEKDEQLTTEIFKTLRISYNDFARPHHSTR